MLALHTITSEPGSLVLLLSPTMRQSQELFRKALDLYHELRAPVATQASSALRLELTNGSRIVSLPGQELTIRGYSGVRLLAVDEAARVPDALYFSVRPMLAVSGGRLLALSTPFGTRGWWYQAWHSNEPWERFEVPARQCPRISTEFLEEERRAMGEWCTNVNFSTPRPSPLAARRSRTRFLKGSKHGTYNPGNRSRSEARPERPVCGPIGRSWVAVALRRPAPGKARPGNSLSGGRGAYRRITRQIVTKTGTCPELFVDATGVGTPVVELLRDRLVWAPKIWAVTLTRGSRRIVKKSSGRSGEIRLGKARMVQRLLALFEARCVHLPQSGEAQALARELLSYEIRVDPNGGERYGAFQAGPHDDLVTALGLAV